MNNMVNHLSPVEMNLPIYTMNLPINLETAFSIQSPNINESISNLDNFLSSSIQEGRESMGILSPDYIDSNFLNISVFGLESLNPHSDLGRESLGILHVDQLNLNLGSQDNFNGLSLLPPVPTNFNFTRSLDTPFLMTPTKYSNSSFNSNSIELPSKIFVLTKSDNSMSSPTGQSLLNNAQIINTPNEANRPRCVSQPLSNELKVKNQKEFFWSTGRPIKTNFVTTNIYCNKLKFDDDKEDIFYNSVFIEGNHLAQKIADGSFLNEDAPANGILCCTPQPDWPDFDESELDKQKSSESNSETILKAIDNMFPATSQIDDFKIKTSRSDSTSSKSREAKDILHNLSEIFNNSHRSEKQKSEGRMLINNLVELLNNSQYIHDGEDSGNSSNPENELVEKLAVHSNKILNDDKVANVSDLSERDLSCESRTKKRLSQTFCPIKSVHQKTERRGSLNSGSTLNYNKTSNADVKKRTKQNSAAPLKLKPKPLSKKGPLIAIIPVKDMKKPNSSPNTSDKGRKIPISKTSTPINEPKLKPPFTSTPRNNSSKAGACKPKMTRDNSFDSNNSNDGSKKSETSKVSKLRRTSLTKDPLSSKIQMQPKPVRRNTISEGMGDNIPGRKRSNSLGKETGIMSMLPMIRQNLLKSSYYNKKNGILSESNAKVESTEEQQVSLKVADKSVKLKKNKENLRP